MARGSPRSGWPGTVPGLLLAWSWVAVAGAACASPSRQTVVERFFDAYNDGRPTTALHLFAEDAVLRQPDGESLRGRRAIGGRLAWDSVLAGQLHAGAYAVSGDTVRVRSLVRRDSSLGLLGIPEIQYEPGTAFVVRSGRIASLSFTQPVAESFTAVERRMADFLPWAQHEYPDRLRRIRPDGSFDYQARRAADWLSLLREWKTARSPAGGRGR